MSHGPVGDDTPSIYDDDPSTSSGLSAIRIASVAALGGLLFGYDSAVINGAVDALQKHFAISNFTLGVAVASALIGAALGAVTAGRLADRIGRIAVMKIAAVLFLLSAIGTAVAPHILVVVVFRVIGGIGVGVASVIAPAYIAETSPPGIRGRLGSLQQLAIVTGIFLSLAVDWVLAELAGGSGEELWLNMEAWRWMFLMMAVPAVVYGLLAFTIPESPRYLIAAQRIPEARRVLTMLLGQKNLEITITRIQSTLEREDKPSWRDLRKPAGGIYGIVWVGLFLSIFQQFVGINVIFYYSNVLWQAVGFDESSSFIITVITSVTNIVTTLIAIALIDKIGRKPLLLIGSSGMAVTLATMAVIFGTAPQVDGQPQLGDVAGPVALVAANLFVVAFGMSWGPVVWVLLGEMFPNRIRAAALGLAAAAQWIANFAISVSFPALREVLGAAYGFYAVCAALSFVFVWRWVAETKGKNLEDMHADALGG
ncbi:MFS transporter, sugar porter family [Mycolicibacterium phlei]|uniref:Major facilitator transporter n=1 Tax=Mycolicibacterium phlei DSM 43239 = CCUG 21000 TaxID=1226750 RepID=A0A5N5UVP3_MYCPH|nr:sugar porter family MFS transporter [Mycolicibacterium phlei]VEG10150.1 MFS transporter, sugar porter family [Mycobacteroides chelonae]AMO62045.1 D-xylose-proton symporter [Mycolicibacterium phlei]KAB7753665.1 major facilitator transporter [Mycolicibacterium phlei DSM 43239 = CCUG 21000]KXW63162.1 major facilitator transporter [Mycolicibacterium phlei DSM 43070]KXW64902.1 major facilitator transporter [Mycolicibacterium phlei DSM 43072]